jgi:hypothetical protein
LNNAIIATEPFRWLGETIGFWVQTATVAISAAAGIWFGLIRSPEKQAARRATIDIIIAQNRDEATTEARQKIREIHQSQDYNLTRFVEQTNSEEYKAILTSLNNYEFIASGIRVGCFDEKIYKRLRYTTVLRDWEYLTGFVVAFRNTKGKATLFQDLEWLYARWKQAPLKPD